MSTSIAPNSIWYTTSGSLPPAYPGLYSCTLNPKTNKTTCTDPYPLFDKWSATSSPLNMWNVQLKSKEGGGSNPNISPTIYAMSDALLNNSSSIFGSILRADPSTGAIQTFFNLVEPSPICAPGVDQAIYAIDDYLMHSFALDPASDDIYVTWSAYVCDCSSNNKCNGGLSSAFDFRVGVSKLETSNKDCVLPTNNYAKASWNDCTAVVATLSNGCSFNPYDVGGNNCIDNSTLSSVTLSDSGFAVARSELTGKPQFFVSMLVNSYKSDFILDSSVNEVWAVNMGGSPETTQKKIDPVAVKKEFSQVPGPMPDTGSIQLRLAEKTLAPVGMCRTAYDAGIFCQDLKAGSGSGAELISVTNSSVFLSKSQLNETCFVGIDGANAVPTVATGLAVSWPDIIYFGCVSSVPGVGNFSSVTRDGTVSQVLDDAYPGSILFGVPLTSAASHLTVALSAVVAVSSLFLMVDYI